jgi:membrane-associated phospholipid phosphatase
MKKIDPKTVIHSIVAFLSFLSLFGNVYLVSTVDDFASPLLFALGLVIELLLLVIFAYSFVRSLKQPLHILASVLLSAWGGMLTNPYVKRVSESKNLAKSWLKARLDRKNPFGLLLTFGVVVSLDFFINFVGILREVETHGPITRIDTRVINLMPSIRTPLQTSFFRFITFTANYEIILLLVVLVGAILWRKRQAMLAGAFVAAVIAEEIVAYALKHLVGRMRPSPSFSDYQANSFSFPSGHVLRASVLFGFLSYLLYRSVKSSLLRLGIILGYILSVALVALSRVYLGVHFPSDVLASVLMGAALLTLIITGIEITIRYQLWGQSLKNVTNRLLGVVPIVVVLVSIVTSPILIHLTPVASKPAFTIIETLNDVTVKTLPLYSETLTGKTMEPINFIYIGSEQQIARLFLSHGWYKADPSTLSNTLKALSVGFQGHQYLNAPVTPSYLAAKPENLAFQRPTKSNSLRQRHHTRLWRTAYKLADGREIWVATASFDEGIEFAGPAKLPTHHIDPNIDAERAYIANSLGLTDLVYLHVVNPQAGTNASGDTFFTDGKALMINLGGG